MVSRNVPIARLIFVKPDNAPPTIAETVRDKLKSDAIW
nr:MAG TPA: hypothetical protein [Caudoviricetes sp.]